MTVAPPPSLSADDLSRLRAGLAQRVRALEVVVADAQGARRAVAEGVLPGAVLVRARGYSRQARGTPLPAVALPLAAFDLDLDPTGRWRVVASHVGGAASWPVHHRPDADLDDLADQVPDPARTTGVGRPPAAGRRRTGVAAALAACAPGAAVLLAPTPAPGLDDPWSATARAHGVPLVRGSDLVVSAGRLLVRTTAGPAPVGVVLRALDDDDLDPVVSDAPGAAHGCPGLLTAVRAGSVALAPALGAGLADDEEVRRRTPDLVRWALGEEPLLGEAAHAEGVPLVRLVTVNDGRGVDVVPALLDPDAALEPRGATGASPTPGSTGPAGPVEPGDPAGAPVPVGEGAAADVDRLWRGGPRPSLLPPAAPVRPPRPVVDLRARTPALAGRPC